MNKPLLPTGLVTFVLTDVEGSTRHWGRPDASAAMARQRELIASAVAHYGGRQPLEQGEGDSTVSVFVDPSDALAATVAIQRRLGDESWPAEPVRVRIGVHTGTAVMVDERTYGGQGIIRCARLRDIARGGQVLVSHATAVVAEDRLPADVGLRVLVPVRLKGLDREETPRQLLHPDLEVSFAALATDGSAAGLPNHATSFVGRAAEIVHVRGLTSGSRLVTVTGAGGSGKTRFAHQVALAGAEDFAEGAVWVDLGRVDSSARVASEAAAACGLAESPGGVDAVTMVASHLSSFRRLVVIDNCEHVLDGVAALVEAVLERKGRSVILATSREPLGVVGERVWRIPSLDVPVESAELDVARAASAVELFGDRARLGLSWFVIDHHTVDVVVAICRRLDGIPLAIELAAARLRTMSLEDVLEGLNDRFRLLAAGPRSMERHRTLLASIDWSHDLLDQDERILFRRLGIVAAPFSWAAAEAITADEILDGLEVFDVLARLVDKSLVHHDGRRYSMLETIRQYANQKAVDAGELPALRERHLQWFLAQASQWGFERGPVTIEVFEEAERVLPDLRVAIDWAMMANRSDVVQLLYPIGDVAGARARYTEVLELAHSVCGAVSDDTLAWAERLSPLSRWIPFASADWWVLPTRRLLEDDGLSPRLRNRLEFALVSLDVYDGADGAADRAEALLAAGRADHDDVLIACIGSNLAIASAVNGDLVRADRVLSWIERRFPEDPVYGPLSHAARIFIGLLRGEINRTVEFADQRPMQLIRVDPTYLADGLLAVLAGSSERLRAVEAEIKRLEFQGFGKFIPSQIRFWSALKAGDLDSAALHLAAMESDLMLVANQSHFFSIELALAMGDLDLAAARAEGAVARLDGRHLPLQDAFGRLAAAEVAHAAGDSTRARSDAHLGLDLAERHQMRLVSVPLLELLGVLAGEAGDLETAGRLVGACDAFRAQNGLFGQWPYLKGQVDAMRPRLDALSLEQGAVLSIDEAAVMVKGSRGERGRPRFGWESLTPAEHRVVALAAEGLSNRQIADKLFVNVSTVKSHFVHVHRKLAVNTRAELLAATLSRPVAPEA